MASGAGGTEWISRPSGANPALMVQVNYKQGPPAVLSNKTWQESNCPELECRGTQRAWNTLTTGKSNFPMLSFSSRPSQQAREREGGRQIGNSQERTEERCFQTTAGCPAQSLNRSESTGRSPTPTMHRDTDVPHVHVDAKDFWH